MSAALSRRTLLTRAAWVAGAALVPAALTERAYGAVTADDPFTLGVASGEPAPAGVVLWTRLAPRPDDPDGGLPPRSIPVGWEVADDPDFRRIAARGRTLAGPAAGHAVHVEVDHLRPGREYFYRFHALGAVSPVGRTLTAPEPGAEPARLRLAFASCQKYEAGFFAAHRYLAADRPDLVLFLGDYIYEQDPGSKDAVRLHRNPEPTDLAGYRIRYATYRSDPMLQAAHAVAPWMVIWDDHEVENDYGADRDQDFNAKWDGDPAAFLRRRAAAYQAYFEHMPLRRRARPVGPDMLLHRSLDWGRLAQMQFVDDRQHRAVRACLPASAGRGKLIPDCPERRDPARSMLGATQERWLLGALAASRAHWNLLAQQTLFAPMALPSPDGGRAWSSDGWDGYPATRERIVNRWREARVSNPVVLGGDVHAFAVAEVRAGPDEPVAAPCFVGGSISSLGPDAAMGERLKALNPHIRRYDGTVRGYGLAELTREATMVAFRRLADARRADSELLPSETYALEAGRPTLTTA